MGGPDGMSVSADVLQILDLIVDGHFRIRRGAKDVVSVKPRSIRRSRAKRLLGLRQSSIQIFIEKLRRDGIHDGMIRCVCSL